MQCIDAYATGPERQAPEAKRLTHLLELFVFWMEEAGDVAPADLAPSPLGTVGALPQVVQLLGRKAVGTRYDEIVLEIEGLVLVMGEYDKNFGLREGANLLDRPFYFVRKHFVHRRDDLYWHVNEPL